MTPEDLIIDGLVQQDFGAITAAVARADEPFAYSVELERFRSNVARLPLARREHWSGQATAVDVFLNENAFQRAKRQGLAKRLAAEAAAGKRG